MRIVWSTCLWLLALFFLGLCSLFVSYEQTAYRSLPFKASLSEEAPPCHFVMGIKEARPSFAFHRLSGELSVIRPSVRPGLHGKKIPTILSLGDRKKIIEDFQEKIPLSIDSRGAAQFAESSPYWIELVEESVSVLAKCFVEIDGEGVFLVEERPLPFSKTEVSSSDQFDPNSPFRALAAAKWMGQDLLKERFGEKLYKIEMGSVLEIGPAHWLGYDQDGWRRVDQPSARFLARIEQIEKEAIYLEGWENESHVRIAIPRVQGNGTRPKVEELFSGMRVRSDKEISCILEKQCLILKLGDWVLKENGKWKIIRKKRDRDLLLEEDPGGELFIFERIEQVQGQKKVVGSFYSSSRTQVVSVELPTGSHRIVKKTQKA